MSDDRPIWARDGHDWPNRAASRFVEAGSITWHVQVFGRGPVLVLIHGTGAATHSWRAVAPLLAEHFTVVAPDLPGHGFTDPLALQDTTLPGMAEALGRLLRALDLTPDLAAGHSAGAAILIRMALDRNLSPRAIVSFNGAIMPLYGATRQLFSPLAKALVLNPFMPRLFAWGASRGRSVEGLIGDTGSSLDSDGIEFYSRLLARPGHVAGALRMMAGWDLDALASDLPRLDVPLVLVVGDNDRAVPPADAARVRAVVQKADIFTLARLGHLAHEEDPKAAAAAILKAAHTFGPTGSETS